MRRQSPMTVEDEALATRIKVALREDSEMGGQPIDVHAENGTVTLVGRVDSERQKEAAGELARRAMAVKHVVNELVLVHPEEP